MTAAQQSVLVVDDEPSMRTALRANFQCQGWTVETASGAQEAFCSLSKCAIHGGNPRPHAGWQMDWN